MVKKARVTEKINFSLKMLLAFCLLTLLMEHVDVARANPDWSADMSAKRWNVDATQRINKLLNRRFNGNLAKNIILFLGDGMGISTVTAGRIRKGQLKGNNGEEESILSEIYIYIITFSYFCFNIFK